MYASWTPVAQPITYVLDGGTNDPSNPAKLTYYETASIVPAVRPGYSFDGWFDADGKVVTTLSELTAPVTVYAKWTPLVYKVTYVYNGGSIQPKNPTIYTVEDDVKLYESEKPGNYSFVR